MSRGARPPTEILCIGQRYSTGNNPCFVPRLTFYVSRPGDNHVVRGTYFSANHLNFVSNEKSQVLNIPLQQRNVNALTENRVTQTIV